MLQCITSSKRMLNVTNTKYITMYASPRSLPSLHRNKAMLMISTSSMPTSSRTEQNSPLLSTDTGCPLWVALNSSHGIGRLCINKYREEKKMESYSTIFSRDTLIFKKLL